MLRNFHKLENFVITAKISLIQQRKLLSLHRGNLMASTYQLSLSFLGPSVKYQDKLLSSKELLVPSFHFMLT